MSEIDDGYESAPDHIRKILDASNLPPDLLEVLRTVADWADMIEDRLVAAEERMELHLFPD